MNENFDRAILKMSQILVQFFLQQMDTSRISGEKNPSRVFLWQIFLTYSVPTFLVARLFWGSFWLNIWSFTFAEGAWFCYIQPNLCMRTSFVWEVLILYRKFSTKTNISYSLLGCVSLVTFFSSRMEGTLVLPLVGEILDFEEKGHFWVSIHTYIRGRISKAFTCLVVELMDRSTNWIKDWTFKYFIITFMSYVYIVYYNYKHSSEIKSFTTMDEMQS